MATLDDKLLGEKLHYYCSSSEDEDNNEDDDDRRGNRSEAQASEPQPPTGDGPNTGPKGVIEDWRRYKQLETEKREEQEAERYALAKRLALTCRSEREDREAKEKEEKLEAELDGLLDEEEFLQSYIQKRMKEMLTNQVQSTKRYGEMVELLNGDDYLLAIDNQDDKNSIVVIVIHEKFSSACKNVVTAAREVSRDYPHVKFCSIEATTVGLSRHFKVGGVPAILTYKNGELLASFVRITDTLGDDFYPSDLESFLIENGVLVDKDLVPTVVRGPISHAGDEADSD